MADRKFEVLVGNRDYVETSLVRLNARAARKGLPVLSWSWGTAYASFEKDATDREIRVARIPLVISGEVPCYAGWSFAAALQHIEGGTIVRSVWTSEIPVHYRTRGGACDHCKVSRRRDETFVLYSSERGEWIQVGSSCVGDFLGTDHAGNLAAAACDLADAYALAIGGEESEAMGGGKRCYLLGDYLPFVARCVRTEGWISRAAATGANATADVAWDDLVRGKGPALESEDLALAAAAEAWAAALPVEGASEYLHNLRAVARTGLVDARTIGIAASMVIAYQKAMARAVAESSRVDVHVGEVGMRVAFGAAAKGKISVLSSEPVTLEFVTGYETAYGYTTVLRFRTSDGAALVWKASGVPAVGRDDVGKRYSLVGTIKAHDEYKGAKQTTMSRCALTEVTEASRAA